MEYERKTFEKIENELITSFRMQSYTYAFIAAVIIALTNTLFEKHQENFQGLGNW